MESIFEDNPSEITEIDLIKETKEPVSIPVISGEKKDNNKKLQIKRNDNVLVHILLSRELYSQISALLYWKEGITLSSFVRDCIKKEMKELLKNSEFKKIYELKYGTGKDL